MKFYTLFASNNQTFRFTRDLSAFVAAGYAPESGVIRMQMRVDPTDDAPAYEWLTNGVSGGTVVYDPATKLVVFAAPLPDMAAFEGLYYFDARLELAWPGAVVGLFGGSITFGLGITRFVDDASRINVASIGDTVVVRGEAGAPVPLPLSLTTAVALAQQAAAAALAALAAILATGGSGTSPSTAGQPMGLLLSLTKAS